MIFPAYAPASGPWTPATEAALRKLMIARDDVPMAVRMAASRELDPLTPDLVGRAVSKATIYVLETPGWHSSDAVSEATGVSRKQVDERLRGEFRKGLLERVLIAGSQSYAYRAKPNERTA